MRGFIHRDQAHRKPRHVPAGAAALILIAAALAFGQQSAPPGLPQASAGQQTPDPGPTPLAIPAAGRSPEAANAERRRQIAEDASQLLQLATGLKAEVDKTDKDTLSLGVIRKADEIEKLARAVKDKMKLGLGTN